MIETTKKVILNGIEGIVKVDKEDMYSVGIGSKHYVVPSGVADLISDLLKEISAQQNRRNVDRFEIEDVIKEKAATIARELGDSGMLKYGTWEKVPLPPGWESEDGTKTTEYYGVAARKILSILSGVTDKLLKAYEDSGGLLL